MAPTATDYLHGLRRLWWVPLATILGGIALGLWASSDVRPTAVTSGNVLFTFRIDDPGDDSAGSARGAEANVAQSRLHGYIQLARSSPEVKALLDSAGIEEPPTASSTTGGFQDGGADALIDVVDSGLVEIRVKNADLSQATVNRLVQELSREVVRQTVATDAQQVTPSLQPDALITEAQITEEPASRVIMLALPVLLLFTLGLGIVYLLVWHQDRIYTRRDIEERLGARVLGDFGGRPSDAPAIALAMGKGRESGTTVLLVPAGRASPDDTPGVCVAVAAAGSGLGLTVAQPPLGAAGAPRDSAASTGSPPDQIAPSESPATSLTMFDAPAGLDADSLRAATYVDIVALVVEYETTSYRDLRAAGQTLAEVTEAEIAVIGVYP